MHQPITIATLRDHVGTYRLYAYGPACRHEAWLNLMQLAQAAEWDAPVSAVQRSLRCLRCGAKGPESGRSTTGGR